MGLEEVMVGPDAWDIRPLCGRYRVGVHVVYLRERGSQHERGVGGYDELAVIEPGHPGDVLRSSIWIGPTGSSPARQGGKGHRAGWHR